MDFRREFSKRSETSGFEKKASRTFWISCSLIIQELVTNHRLLSLNTLSNITFIHVEYDRERSIF